MSAPLIVLGFAATLGLMIMRSLAVDELKGHLARRITASVEATIASLPAELQADWADEWRAELATVISMPVTAGRFARGLRHSARELTGDPAITPAQQRFSALKNATERILAVALTTVDTWIRRVSDALAVDLFYGLIGFIVTGFVGLSLIAVGRVDFSDFVAGSLVGIVVGVGAAAGAQNKEYGPRATQVDRLRAALEGRGDELVLTHEQQREVDAMLKSWGALPISSDEPAEPS